MMALGTFALAATGAVVSHSATAEKDALPVVQGFIKGNPQATNCHSPQNCQTEDNQMLCRTSGATGTQLWGKQGDKCEVQLYRIVP